MATHGFLETPAKRKKIIALVLDGMSDAQVARAVSTKTQMVTRQAITLFRQRHQDVLAPAEERMVLEATDYAIANKVNRIATNDMLKNLLLAVKDERAAGRTGIETGLVVMHYKALGSGDSMTIVEEYEIDPALVNLIDKLHNSTSDELGQKPRPNVNINTGIQVMIRDYGDIDTSRL